MIVYFIGMAVVAATTILLGQRWLRRRRRNQFLDVLVVLAGLVAGVLWPFVLLFGVPAALVGVPIWLGTRRRRDRRPPPEVVAAITAQLPPATNGEPRRARALGTPRPVAALPTLSASQSNPTTRPEPHHRPTSGHRPLRQPSTPAAPPPGWVPPGQTVRIGRYVVPDGMVYVGGVPPRAAGTHQLAERIDPALPVDERRPAFSGEGMTYWPAYHSIPPACRSAYLSWLADGRRAPDAYIGYVFLYFYGLEKRALVDTRTDPAARAELPRIFAEVTRLLEIYGTNHSFRSYAGDFQQCLRVLLAQQHGGASSAPPDPATTPRYPTPLELRIAVGGFARNAQPVPGEWAYSWAMLHPEIYPRTPATRCPEEFRRLFLIRYRRICGQGLVVHPLTRRLSLSYRPASASLTATELTLDVPDVLTAATSTRQLGELVESCTNDLDAYSRLLGRKPDAAGALPALALLPGELLDEDMPALQPLRELVERRLEASTGPAVIQSAELTGLWPGTTPGTFVKADSVALAQLLERLGIGIEPDVRLGGPVLGTGPAVLFRIMHAQPTVASAEYAAATTLLHLAAVVSAADDDVSQAERQHLVDHLESGLHLSAGERERLAAHLAWLLAADIKLSGLKKRLAALTPAQRRQVTTFLTAVAAIDGHISPGEVTTLRKIYTLLELDPETVYGDLHTSASAHARGPMPPPAAAPITVRVAQLAPSGYRIPTPAPATPQPVAGEITLDRELIETRIAESAAVSALLADLFTDDADSNANVVIGRPPESPVAPDVAQVDGLDAVHSALVRELVKRPVWTRAELEDLCDQHGLLLDGALDTVNEAALDATGDPLVEDDADQFRINNDARGELLG